jgi:hypothetical protein
MHLPHLRHGPMLAIAMGLTLLACGWITTGPISTAPVPATTAEAADQHLALTIYNQGSALVRDRRQFTLTTGANTISFDDVAASIDPTSVLFKALDHTSQISVLEQNFEYDLVGASALLKKYLGQTITVITQDGLSHRGKLLAASDALILQDPSGRVDVITSNSIQQYSFPELPEGLISRPTLAWQLLSNRAGPQDFELTYLTSGVGWQSDYVVLLNSNDTAIDLDGWVTLSNNSGASFRDAILKLVAGDLQRLQDQGLTAPQAALAAERAATDQTIDQRSFFEYHLYQVPRPVTIANNETKQIQFVSVQGVPALKFFVYDGSQCGANPYYCFYAGYPQTDPSYGIASNAKVMVMVEFDTEQVKADLPKGRVRIYKQDIDGAPLLIGEDSIDHTPQGEHVRLYVGDAFDIVGERVQTDFTRPSDNTLNESFQITLRNHKDEAVEVRVVEHLFRWSDWQILRASDDFTKLDSSTVEFRVQVPANGEHTLTYTAHYFWP